MLRTFYVEIRQMNQVVRGEDSNPPANQNSRLKIYCVKAKNYYSCSYKKKKNSEFLTPFDAKFGQPEKHKNKKNEKKTFENICRTYCRMINILPYD